MQYLDITDVNPALFLQAVEEAILDGYRVTTSIQGYPSLSTILKEVLLTKGADVEIVPLGDSSEVFVTEYDSIDFMLQFQNAVLNGFTIDTQSVYFDSVKEVKLTREKASAKVVLEAPKAEPEKPVKAPKAPKKPKVEA